MQVQINAFNTETHETTPYIIERATRNDCFMSMWLLRRTVDKRINLTFADTAITRAYNTWFNRKKGGVS